MSLDSVSFLPNSIYTCVFWCFLSYTDLSIEPSNSQTDSEGGLYAPKCSLVRFPVILLIYPSKVSPLSYLQTSWTALWSLLPYSRSISLIRACSSLHSLWRRAGYGRMRKTRRMGLSILLLPRRKSRKNDPQLPLLDYHSAAFSLVPTHPIDIWNSWQLILGFCTGSLTWTIFTLLQDHTRPWYYSIFIINVVCEI